MCSIVLIQLFLCVVLLGVSMKMDCAQSLLRSNADSQCVENLEFKYFESTAKLKRLAFNSVLSSTNMHIRANLTQGHEKIN